MASRRWEGPETREGDRAGRAIATDHTWLTGSGEGLSPQRAVGGQDLQQQRTRSDVCLVRPTRGCPVGKALERLEWVLGEQVGAT